MHSDSEAEVERLIPKLPEVIVFLANLPSQRGAEKNACEDGNEDYFIPVYIVHIPKLSGFQLTERNPTFSSMLAKFS